MKTQVIANDALLFGAKKSNLNNDVRKNNTNFSDVMKNTAKTKAEREPEVRNNDSKARRTVDFSQRHIVSNSKPSSLDKKEIDELEERKVESDTSVTAENPVLQGIAMLLGVDLKELNSMLAKLDISPENFLNPSDSAVAMDKLTSELGLSEDQSSFLKDAVAKFTSLVQDAIKNIYLDENSQNLVKVEGLKVDLNAKAFMEDESFRTKISSEIKNVVESLKQGSQTMLSSINEQTNKYIGLFNNSGMALKDKLSLKKEEVKNADAREKRYDNESVESGTEDTVKPASLPTQLQTSDSQSSLTNNQEKGYKDINLQAEGLKNAVSNDDVSIKTHKNTSDVRMAKNQIMQQVVDKAKVLVDQHKSEMVMELKPESLGKLVLKIVTENGIVAAKFLAESQQVKEVIEANMQNLKDSLQKQGLTIQDVSVSVGQDNQNSQGRQEFERRNKKDSKSDGKSFAIESGEGLDEVLTTNPYEDSDSSINVTA